MRFKEKGITDGRYYIRNTGSNLERKMAHYTNHYCCLNRNGVGTYLMLPNSKSVVAIIEMNYPGIELGQNPDGS